MDGRTAVGVGYLMLRRITANKPSFLPINFTDGMNIVLADEAEDAVETDSRNAQGKTTLLLIINYLLGGNLASQLKPLQGQDWQFSLTLDLISGQVTVSRSLDAGNSLEIHATSDIEEIVSAYADGTTIRLDAWKDLLGLALFRLEPNDESGRYGLSVRTLLGYVVRTEAAKDPLKTFPQQPAWSSRQHLSFMLGLDWRRVQSLQEVGRKLDALGAVATAQEAGLLTAFGNEADLLLERSEAQRRLEAQRQRIDQFQVLDDPTGVVDRADQLTEQISALRDEALVDQRMQTLYRSALSEAQAQSVDPLASDVATMYEQTGSILGEQVRRRLDEVQAFHEQLTLNRSEFLSQALAEIAERSVVRDQSLQVLASQRNQLMRLLSAGGALQELLAMRDDLSGLEANLTTAEFRLQQSREVTQNREQLRAQRASERQAAQEQLTANREKLDRIAERFDARMQSLYGESGVLTAEVDDDGYKFAISVAGQSSTGVNKMKLFCLDLSLLEEGVQTGHHPDFLIHDSSVFDGVDPRQIAAALLLAQSAVSSVGGQYICTLNSNDLRPDILETEWFPQAVVRTILDTEDGGILGVRF